MNLSCPCLQAAALAVLLFTQAAAMAQATPPRTQVGNEGAPAVAAGLSCVDKWRSYQRSATCYARFRTHRAVKPEAARRCGRPLKEPVDCPRP